MYDSFAAKSERIRQASTTSRGSRLSTNSHERSSAASVLASLGARNSDKTSRLSADKLDGGAGTPPIRRSSPPGPGNSRHDSIQEAEGSDSDDEDEDDSFDIDGLFKSRYNPADSFQYYRKEAQDSPEEDRSPISEDESL